jgi:hypothetical protein
MFAKYAKFGVLEKLAMLARGRGTLTLTLSQRERGCAAAEDGR